MIGTDAPYLETAGYGGQAGGEFRVRGPNCDDRLPEVWPVYLYTVSRVGTRLTPAYTYNFLGLRSLMEKAGPESGE